MKPREIMVHAIDQAMANGWVWDELEPDDWAEMAYPEKLQACYIFGKAFGVIIFRHDFAKALWGESHTRSENSSYECASCGGTPSKQLLCFQIHLQQMVVAENQLEYLSEHLPK